MYLIRYLCVLFSILFMYERLPKEVKKLASKHVIKTKFVYFLHFTVYFLATYCINKVSNQIKSFKVMEKKNVVFFYGVKNVNGEFSNHYVREFVVNGNTFRCVEQYMMAQKALIFRDFETFNKVMNSVNPAEMKHLGREVKNFDAEKWNEVKVRVVKNAVFAKFSQNWDLRKMLLETGDKMIVESNPMDRIWGIGMCKSDKEVMNKMDEWGENLLGKIMMEVREELKGMEFDDEMEDVVVVSEKRKSGDEDEKEIPVVKVVRKDKAEEYVKGKKCKVENAQISKGEVIELYREVWVDLNYGDETKMDEKWVFVKRMKVGEFVSEVEARKFAREYKMLSGTKRNGKMIDCKMKKK